MSVLEVRDLRAEIRLRDSTVRAVDGVSLAVAEGETLGLVGESGCGKTMLGTSVIRLLPPGGRICGGQVLLDGRDLVPLTNAEMRTVRGGEIGMVFQDPMTSLDPTMPIGRQIAESVQQHKGLTARPGWNAPLRCCRSSACRGPPNGWAIIRISCPAACASG